MLKNSSFAHLRDIRVESIGYWVMFWMTIFALYFSPFRHVAYAVPFIALCVGLADRRFQTGGLNAPFVFLVVAGLALSPLANTDGFKDIFFICSGVSAALVLSRRTVDTKMLLAVFVVGIFAEALVKGVGFSRGFVLNITTSESTFESSFGFLFGALAVYAGLKRQKWLAILAFMGAVLALKRIVLLAVIVCWILCMLPDRIKQRMFSPWVMVPLNLLIVAVLILYANHAFDHWVGDLFGQSANQFGMGRQQLFFSVARDIYLHPQQFIFFGTGPGGAYETLSRSLGAANLHSDLLKILFEYGLIVFCGFLWLAYRVRSASLKIMFLYANILFVTDNVLIYHFFLFFLCLFALALESDSKEAIPGRPKLGRPDHLGQNMTEQ